MGIRFGRVLATFAGLCLASTSAQSAGDSVDDHLLAAKTAAGLDFAGALVATCVVPNNIGGAQRAPGPRVDPPREKWHAEPAKIYDNFYWVGTKEHSSWALKTRAGIILFDTLYNYTIEDEIVGGLKKLGLDPATVKYVLISHGHGDHDEGARLFQEKYGAKVVMGAADWDGLDKQPDMPGGKPKRDIAAMDGQKITLGDTSVTLVSTPGHTPGTTSFLFTVMDNGKPVSVAYSGGTALQVIYKDVDKLNGYVNTQEKFGRMAAAANATVLITNHSVFDNAATKAQLVALRKPGGANPFEVGGEAVTRYLTVLSECAKAQIARLKTPNS